MVEGMQEAWAHVGNEDDRRPILNSPLTGLVEDDGEYGSDDENE